MTMDDDPRPPITWQHVDETVGGHHMVGVRAVHPGYEHVFVDGWCSCGVVDLAVVPRVGIEPAPPG